MSEGGYKIRDQYGIHFLSFAVVGWIDVFSRKAYCDILLDSLRYCQQHKFLSIHGWVLMTNHVHLLASSKSGDLSGALRDFKKFTANKILKAIENNYRESRRNWMLPLFREAGEANSRNTTYQFWQQDNRPKECYSYFFTHQKLNYIHMNPVVAGFVDQPWEYRYSSARDYRNRLPEFQTQVNDKSETQQNDKFQTQVSDRIIKIDFIA